MLDLKFIREQPEVVKAAVRDKRVSLDVDELLARDQALLDLSRKVQELQERRNQQAKLVPKASAEDRPKLIQEGREIGERIAALKPEIEQAEARLRELMLLVPGVPASVAPRGASEADNVQVRTWGTPREFSFKPLDHVELLQKNGWYELDRIAKVAGSRSYALKGQAVLLEQNILRLALDTMVEKGFTPLSVPSFATEAAFVGTGHFPTGREQVYYIEADDKYLTGTSEVTLNTLHSGEILSEEDLPVLYAGMSACFRREAGSAGKDVRGLIRVHQFNKVEQYVMCKNEDAESEAWHQRLLETSEQILQALELPYRVVECCTGDMGLGKYRMFDVESWVPSEKLYRETHSCSNLHDWQARRADLRYRGKDGKVRFCHTLNNTAIATPRVLVPFMENHQQEDGSIRLPEVLRPYFRGKERLSGPR
ncbi:MAG TPA: serine--tRNA ligase [Polyangiaceae bacterium]|jgi:seryl-tRNA synthetase|nr:serine--tRNA ligase [Polyangiaceae bacterium]